MIEYSEMNEDDAAKTDAGGKLIYGAGNVCNHFYTVAFLKNVTDDELIFHVARKKIKVKGLFLRFWLFVLRFTFYV